MKLLYIMGFIEPVPVTVGSPMGYNPELLHVTFLGAHFIPDANLESYVEEVLELSKTIQPLTFTPVGEKFFGLSNEIPVMTLATTPQISALHQSLVGLVEKFGGLIAGDKFGDQYTAHVSYGRNLTEPFTINNMLIAHHAGGFGEEVECLGNYQFNCYT